MTDDEQMVAADHIRYAGYEIYARAAQRPAGDLHVCVLVKDPAASGFCGETAWEDETTTTRDELGETTRALLRDAKAYADGNDTADRIVTESLAEVFNDE